MLDRRLYQVPRGGGDPEALTEGPVFYPQVSSDGRHYYFTNFSTEDIWEVPVGGGQERQVTDLSGKRGALGNTALATDGTYLYFTWEDELGDIWVMDVIRE